MFLLGDRSKRTASRNCPAAAPPFGPGPADLFTQLAHGWSMRVGRASRAVGSSAAEPDGHPAQEAQGAPQLSRVRSMPLERTGGRALGVATPRTRSLHGVRATTTMTPPQARNPLHGITLETML